METRGSDKLVALDLIARLPDDASMDSIIYTLAFWLKVQRGIEQVERGEVLTHEEVKARIASWRST